jgi:hypothetical protein
VPSAQLDRASPEHLRPGRVRLDHLQAEIERMRYQVGRQRKDITLLVKAKVDTLAAQALLARMLVRIENLCAQRDALRRELGVTRRKPGAA